MTPPKTSPKQYVVQKKVIATSVAEALTLAEGAPIESVFPDTTADVAKCDAIGFKTIPMPEPE